VPPFKFLADQAFPDSDALRAVIRSFQDSAKGSGPASDAARKLLSRLPKEWQGDLSAVSADALEALRQKLLAGDPATIQAFMPMITTKLTQEWKNGTLSPATDAALVKLINEQRSKTIAAMDAKYNSIMQSAANNGGLLNAFSSPKIPDIVGEAYVKVSSDQLQKSVLIGGTVGAVAGGAAIAGATLAIAAVGGVGGTAANLFNAVNLAVGQGASYTAGAGGASAALGPAVIAAAAIVIGVTETMQQVESTKNYERYVAYKQANKSLLTLGGLDLSNPDNMLQLSTAMSSMLCASLGVKLP
jgi:hypothetical protein